MGEAFIVRKGGAAGTEEPSINFVSSTFDIITFTITNNDSLPVDIFWEVGDSTPDANILSLSGGATSSNQVITGLVQETSYTIFAFANAADKAGSKTRFLTHITPIAPPAYFGNRGVFGGGTTGTSGGVQSTRTQYVTISTTGNAIDLGNLSQARETLAGLASRTRAVFGGGYNSTAPNSKNTIDYFTIGTGGNAVAFGVLTQARSLSDAGCSNGIRGLFGGGSFNLNRYNIIDYITIDTPSNAINFGNLTISRSNTSACSSFTRGVWSSGWTGSSSSNRIDYVTIATTGNAITFGNLTEATSGSAGTSNETRGVFAGGSSRNSIEYITIDTPSNAINFGDLTRGASDFSGCSNGTRAIFGGGSGQGQNTIDFITIATTGNATDFGDLRTASRGPGACSGSV